MTSPELIFACDTDSPKSFSVALSAIAWKQPESQSCCVSASTSGLLFLTEDASCLQASVFLKSSLFRNFKFMERDPYEFRLNLTALVNCLSVFGDTATYLGIQVLRDSDLRLMIQDQGSKTDCVIRTIHCPSEQMNQPNLSDAFSARDSPEIASFLISSYVCRELFRFPNERKNKSCAIAMTINVESRTFEVKAEGAFGAVKSVIPFSQADFQRVNLNLSHNFTANYPVWSLTPVLAAMSNSFETKFKFKGNGMLAVQHGIRATTSLTGIETVVEFILQPLDESVL